MRWAVHGGRGVDESPWVSVALVDVEVPGGERFEHHVVRMPGAASAVMAVGEPVDWSEADRVEWVPIAELRALTQKGEIQVGYSLTALLWLLQLGVTAQSTET